MPWPSPNAILLARESPRTAACRVARASGRGWDCRCRDCARARRPAVVVAACGIAGADDGLNVSIDCRVPDVSCGGLRGSAAPTSRFSHRAGTAVNRSCTPPCGGLEAQLRVHASQRSPGCASTAWRIAARSFHTVVVCPGRPATEPEVRELMAAVEGGGLEMASSTIRKPLPGIQSVFVSRGEEGTALGARESSVCVPEYALGALRYVCVVRREGPRDTPRSILRCRRSRIPRRMDV